MMSHPLYDIKEEEQSEIRSEVTVSDLGSESALEPYYLIGIIADEDTCVGYLLGGIGELNGDDVPNYFLFTKKTGDIELEEAFFDFLNRPEIGLLLVQKEAADIIHNVIYLHQISKLMPIVIEIPGKNGPYDVSIDNILHIADSHEKEKDEKVQEKRQSFTDKKLVREQSEHLEVLRSHSMKDTHAHRESQSYIPLSSSPSLGHQTKDFYKS